MISNEEKQLIEADRDKAWVECMALYVPEIEKVFEEEGVTLERLVEYFQLQVTDQERERSRPAIYGQRYIQM